MALCSEPMCLCGITVTFLRWERCEPRSVVLCLVPASGRHDVTRWPLFVDVCSTHIVTTPIVSVVLLPPSCGLYKVSSVSACWLRNVRNSWGASAAEEETGVMFCWNSTGLRYQIAPSALELTSRDRHQSAGAPEKRINAQKTERHRLTGQRLSLPFHTCQGFNTLYCGNYVLMGILMWKIIVTRDVSCQ
jgi:hypothetical protein